MEKLNEDELQILMDAFERGHIDRKFIRTKSDQELRDYIDKSDVIANSYGRED